MTDVYLWVGLIVTNLVLGSLWVVTAIIGKGLWGRLKRIYSFTVILYWLDRLEEEGTHTFERARQELNK